MTDESTTQREASVPASGDPEDTRGEDRTGEDPDFEEALAELEAIVRSLESEDLDLDEALSLFERGVQRLRLANRLLDDAEGRVEELIEEASGVLAVADVAVEVEDEGEDGG